MQDRRGTMSDVLKLLPLTITYSRGAIREVLELAADGTLLAGGDAIGTVRANGDVFDATGDTCVLSVDTRGFISSATESAVDDDYAMQLTDRGIVFARDPEIPLVGFAGARMYGLALGPANDDSDERVELAGVPEARPAAALCALA